MSKGVCNILLSHKNKEIMNLKYSVGLDIASKKIDICMSDLKIRGVEDILIACTDNLAGFTKFIKSFFPETITQLCIVHQIRNSSKFVVTKDRKTFCNDLKQIYTAVDEQGAAESLKEVKTKNQHFPKKQIFVFLATFP